MGSCAFWEPDKSEQVPDFVGARRLESLAGRAADDFCTEVTGSPSQPKSYRSPNAQKNVEVSARCKRSEARAAGGAGPPFYTPKGSLSRFRSLFSVSFRSPEWFCGSERDPLSLCIPHCSYKQRRHVSDWLFKQVQLTALTRQPTHGPVFTLYSPFLLRTRFVLAFKLPAAFISSTRERLLSGCC